MGCNNGCGFGGGGCLWIILIIIIICCCCGGVFSPTARSCVSNKWKGSGTHA